MYTIDTQVHGYRRGHQLLTSSLALPKDDQSVVDRLSDVAGPLRPNERFLPYLAGYPLPGGTRYVLARTWQDLTVARAGCVRTLSLLIPIAEWSKATALDAFFDLLDPNRFPDDAAASHTVSAPSTGQARLALPEFRGTELLEVLFLEDPKPVAVFDAPTPELIAIRLLTAMWAELRQRFAFSTFARSPRRIEGRLFDLVFAPKDARPKFSDWAGRRIDGRSDQIARHPWTDEIVRRVFGMAPPRLLHDDEIALIGKDDAETMAALRIALLWNELFGKIDRIPTAALGLLDIANSRPTWGAAAFAALDPAIATAALTALNTMPTNEAYDFTGALVRKLQGRDLRKARSAARMIAKELASREPEGAISLLECSPDNTVAELAPSIGDGLSSIASGQTMKILIDAHPKIVGQLIGASGAFANRMAQDETLTSSVGRALQSLDANLLATLRLRFLPLLVEDWQLPAAQPLLETLDAEGIVAEVHHLATEDGFSALAFHQAITDRARIQGYLLVLRDALLEHRPSSQRDAFLEITLRPSRDDVSWLLEAAKLSDESRLRFLVHLLRMADAAQFAEIVSDPKVRDCVINELPRGTEDVLCRMLAAADLPLDSYLKIAFGLLSVLDRDEASKVATSALGRALRAPFEGDEIAIIAQLLDVIGRDIDVLWASSGALGRDTLAPLANRNLRAFSRTSAAARHCLLTNVDVIIHALAGRRQLDLDAGAYEACAVLLADAVEVSDVAALQAAGQLLPLLIRAYREPISKLLAVAFPLVYRELAKENDVPDLLKFVPFVDWDRCKSARHEIVFAFLSSSWPPGDIALIACRCNDVRKILRRTAKSWRGDEYIDRIAEDLSRLSDQCRNSVRKTISEIRSDRSIKYDWRD